MTIAMNINLIASGDDFYPRVLADIKNAKQTILVEMYKFNLTGIGEKIANNLIEKAEQGVDITILVDGIGSKNWGGETLKKMESVGIKTKIYHPIPWQFNQFKHAVNNLPNFKKVFFLFAKINTRNHRKTIMIDEEILYLGSINISDDHLSKADKAAWADCAIRLTDKSAISACKVAFMRALAPDLKNIYQGIQQTITNDSSVIFNNNLVKRKRNFRGLLKRIRKAEHRIWLVSAYFTPNNALLKALTGAASRGVDVRLILPKKSDISFMNLAARYFYNILIASRVKIFEYMPSMMHSKYMLIDDFAMIGSSNLNHRSILHDLEIDYRSNDKKFIGALEDMFLIDKSRSCAVSKSKHKQNIIDKISYRFVILFKIVL